MSTALERITEMTASHYKETASFYAEQTQGLALVLMDVIQALRVTPATDVVPGEQLLFGSYRPSDVVAAARRDP
jgi:hypothetical protein